MLCSSCLPSQALCGYKWTGLILLCSMLTSSPLFLQLQGQIPGFLSHLEEGLLVPQSEALIQVHKGFPFVVDTELFATSSWKYGGNMQECYLLHHSGCLM